ncbi:hypothetical protein DFQ28_011024 [Apophysomyces sp. BC1034]|nr:hypothetical protein DFQ29_009526 [Apophysomyces sp. BC1021]KAG0184510.1 hypothetical protein DFQ28_011024 [Apophysomyces sp. BC1034]
MVALVQGESGRNQSGRGEVEAEHDVNEPGQLDDGRRHDLDLWIGRRNLGISMIGALLWPTISSLIGSCLNHVKWVRQNFPDPFHRNLLGGCLFVVAKDMANLLYKYERIRQHRSRRVKNYYEIDKVTRK